MELNPDCIPPCGLYCGVCRIYAATQAGDLAYLQRLFKIYARRMPQLASATPHDLLCDGCLSTRRYIFCRQCAIRDCARQKELRGCHQCADFPCALIDAFPIPVGRQVILRAIPFWREHGTQAWVQSEEQRYHCPECGGRLFRGDTNCRHCQAQVNVD